MSIVNLRISIPTHRGAAKVVDGVSISVEPGSVLAIVGETGSGKTLTAMSILGVHPKRATLSGFIHVSGLSVVPLKSGVLRQIRGRQVAVVLQNPSTALNPVFTVGVQISELLRVHQGIRKKAELRQRALEYFREVELPRAETLFDAYPHELSGGMKQLVLLAMALACRPQLLVADEPTTALDVTTQSRVLKLFDRIRRERNLAAIWITHDLAVGAHVADNVLVLYAGAMVEYGPVREVLLYPQHPYTQALIGSLPEHGRRISDLVALPGDIPSAFALPSGCRFHPRCPHSVASCRTVEPNFLEVADGHKVACHLYEIQDPDIRR